MAHSLPLRDVAYPLCLMRMLSSYPSVSIQDSCPFFIHSLFHSISLPALHCSMDNFGTTMTQSRFLYFSYYSNGNVPAVPPNSQQYYYNFFDEKVGSALITYNYAAKTLTWSFSYPGWSGMTR